MVKPRSSSVIVGISSYGRDGDPEAFSLPSAYVDAVRGMELAPLHLVEILHNIGHDLRDQGMPAGG